METELKRRKKKIKRLFRGIVSTGYWPGDEPIELNYNNILTDLFSINTLFNNTFEIFKDETTTDQSKATKLLKLRDNNKKIIANEGDASKIVEQYKDPVMIFFKNILSRRQHKRDEAMKANIQKGGDAKINKRAELDIDDVLKNIERVTLEKSKKFNNNIKNNPGYLADVVSEIPKEMLSNDNRNISDLETISDWIFHPLWKLENMPVWGTIIEVPIDFVDSILNNCILLVETIYPIISIILSFAGTAGTSAVVSVIPVVGPILAGSAWEVIIQPFLDWLIPNFLKIIAFFINIWRRDISSAYVNALDFIPFMENTMHVLAAYLIKINKYINIIYPVTNTLRSYTEVSSNLALALIQNPDAFVDIDKFYIDVIKPNKKIIPLIKDLPQELLDKDDVILSIFYETMHDLTKCVRAAVNSKNITACIEDFRLENIRTNITEKVQALRTQ